MTTTLNGNKNFHRSDKNKIKKILKRFNIITLIILGLYFIFSIIAGNYFFHFAYMQLPLEFILYAMMLVGIASFNQHNVTVATLGFMSILIYKITFNSDFSFFEQLMGVEDIYKQVVNNEYRYKEWFVIFNLFGIFIGFPIMASYFGKSKVTEYLIAKLPQGWLGPFILLILIFILSFFIDNIAAALIGGTAALIMFNKNIHIGYVVAIVAAANAGGIGNISDYLNTRMIQMEQISSTDIIHSYIGSTIAFLIFAPLASILQNKKEPIKNLSPYCRVFLDKKYFIATLTILLFSIITKKLLNSSAIGVWIAIGISTIRIKYTDWKVLEKTLPCAIFFMLLIFSAALMPLDNLPPSSTLFTLILGFLSSIFNTIPLMKLAFNEGGYNLGLLIYSIGFGSSMLWFGSPAGIALTNIITEAKAVSRWLYYGWFIVIAYIAGFAGIYLMIR